MVIFLSRQRFDEHGIFGTIKDSKGKFICYSLEHNYGGNAKLAEGEYTCVRHPPNRLPYETFMVENVPDFGGEKVDGILIHVGNYNQDSSGCILLGESTFNTYIGCSKSAFEHFMSLQREVNEFKLVVKKE